MDKKQQAGERIILALDDLDPDRCARLLERLGRRVRIVKNHDLCDSLGAYGAMRLLRHHGAHPHLMGFFDLKILDTPETAAVRARILRDAGASILTVHGRGTIAMIQAAVQCGPPNIFAVLRLTTEERSTIGGLAAVGAWASRALNAGVTGLVTPKADLQFLKENLARYHRKIQLVAPGIRPAGQSADEHISSAPPREAIRNGADLLVVGRPITRASDPVAAFDSIAEEVAQALAERAERR